MSTTKDVLKSDLKKKQKFIRILGGKCCNCGYDKCESALEFHHLIPEEKEFTISTQPHMAFEKVALEIKKCILLCANCHRELHSGYLNIDSINYKLFDEKIYEEELKELNNFKQKTVNYCIDCGKEIYLYSKRCVECNTKNSQIHERPSRNELKNKIRILPFTKIGKEYNITDNAVRKWCKTMNLPYTKKEINSYSDEEWENI